ncbi:alpha-ketoglutarate-dependent dioxygenase AlkB family protein [Sinomicrobium weinanense]|uniref:Alpha-ketoglutarate-dependent dioxygenase AlkB n=1 Tax=Sinomicrobium weinanense TaxID=2842200 RepID=A0A926JWL1_9FLAO|nr:alpha-ketoglutarate-dependent dioxygenase AlkB [Sinomicrobium weinanense]MBC9798522.1 alpha-ketoglutarate-dependent dioxygenase AlkB [Sinomicrobium weinanense]MBU3125785.1 alpha-ketoglutarate-dependent dioxygenase AlkB [Sinomicrobium weinanense]
MYKKDTYQIPLKDADVIYYPGFFPEKDALRYYKAILDTARWQQDRITLFGKTHPQPRLTALYADNSIPYSYSGITMHPYPFFPELLEIRQKVEALCKIHFTSCLLNLYRNGKDSNGWHADDEPELGKNPVIASVSLGAERYFHLKHKKEKQLKHKLLLESGSLLIMKGETQHHWLHQIPKTMKETGQRINLTFRNIIAL